MNTALEEWYGQPKQCPTHGRSPAPSAAAISGYARGTDKATKLLHLSMSKLLH